MRSEQLDPGELLGERVDSVIVGWHCHESNRSTSRLFLRLANGTDVEAHTAGTGALALLRRPVPADFDMDEYGRYEFRDADATEPAALLGGETIDNVEVIKWRDTVIGYRLTTKGGQVILANQADEVFTSDGPLPLDYSDATFG